MRIFVLDAIRSNRRRIALGMLVFFLVVLVELLAISLLVSIWKPLELRVYLLAVLAALGITAVLMPLFYVVGYFSSRWAIARALGSIQAPPMERQKIDLAMAGVCLGMGMEVPEVRISDMNGINAISLTRGRDRATVIVTREAVLQLDRYELEALLAHEAFHVAARDTWLWMFAFAITAFLPFVLAGFATVGQVFMEYGDTVQKEDMPVGGFFGPLFGLLISAVLFIIAYVVLAVFWVPFLVSFYQLVLPKDREFLADAEAVLLTRDPGSVASLLEKARESRSQGLRRGGVFINHMFFNQPQKRFVGPGSFSSDLFNIHPKEEERIARVEAMG